MSVVDTSTWKPFRVGDLFTLERGKLSRVNDLCEGNTPYVGCSNANNGVIGFYDVDTIYLTQGPCIVFIGAGNGSAGYQIYKDGIFACSSGNVCGYCNAMSMESACFIVSVMDAMQNISHEWSFSNGRTLSKLQEQIILLPATPDGEPDWAYMETYMQQVFDREEMFAEHLASLTAEAVADGRVIDTSTWKPFRMTDGLGFVCHHGSRLNKSARIDGDIPFVTAGFENRGVSQFIGNDVAVYSDAITVDMFGNCFFQQGQCAGDDNVYFFVNNAISHYCKLFLSSAVHASIANRFDYSSQFRQSDADSLSVFLPATSDGAPDWAYMEQYMKDIMAVEALFADELDRVYCE